MRLIRTRYAESDWLGSRRQQQTVVGESIAIGGDDVACTNIDLYGSLPRARIDAVVSIKAAIPQGDIVERNIVILPANCFLRSISAAANPAAPPPMITIFSGALTALARAFGVGRSRFSRTVIFPSRCSIFQHSIGSIAGARRASPLRKLKQA